MPTNTTDNPFRPGSGKAVLYEAWKAGGEDAVRACNATLERPLADSTLSTTLSVWRNRLGAVVSTTRTPAQRSAETGALREAAMRRSGAVRIPGRAEIYRLPDGRRVMLQTNMKRGLMNYKGGLTKYPLEAMLIAIPRQAFTLAQGIDVYLVDLEVVLAAMAKAREAWRATKPNLDEDLDVINFDPVNGWVVEATGFADHWRSYLLPDDDVVPATVEVGPRLVEFSGVLAMMDGELLRAPDFEGLVTIMRLNIRFREPDPTNAAYMRGCVRRWNNKNFTGTAETFVRDMHASGLLELVKRQIVLENR